MNHTDIIEDILINDFSVAVSREDSPLWEIILKISQIAYRREVEIKRKLNDFEFRRIIENEIRKIKRTTLAMLGLITPKQERQLEYLCTFIDYEVDNGTLDAIIRSAFEDEFGNEDLSKLHYHELLSVAINTAKNKASLERIVEYVNSYIKFFIGGVDGYKEYVINYLTY